MLTDSHDTVSSASVAQLNGFEDKIVVTEEKFLIVVFMFCAVLCGKVQLKRYTGHDP